MNEHSIFRTFAPLLTMINPVGQPQHSAGKTAQILRTLRPLHT